MADSFIRKVPKIVLWAWIAVLPHLLIGWWLWRPPDPGLLHYQGVCRAESRWALQTAQELEDKYKKLLVPSTPTWKLHTLDNTVKRLRAWSKQLDKVGAGDFEEARRIEQFRWEAWNREILDMEG